MADDRYYGDTLDEISLDSVLHQDKLEDVTLKSVKSTSITVSSYSKEEVDSDVIFTFGTGYEVMNKEILLSPQNVLNLSDVDDYYTYFQEDNNDGLFIPESIPSLEQCAMCGRYLRDYEGESFYCDEDLGHIWCFEYDRVLVFHGECVRDLVNILEERMKSKSSRFVSLSI